MTFSARAMRLLTILVLGLLVAIPAAQGQRANLSTNSLSFGSVAVGSTSAAQTITLSNSSSRTLTISGITVSGDYAQTNTCGTSVAGRGSCTISVTFKPTATGRRRGTLTIRDNANDSPQTASLTGTGTAAVVPVTVSPTSLTFAARTVGTTSPAQTVTVRNNQTVALGISGIAASAEYGQTSNCGSSLANGASCAINVTFTPAATGTRPGSLTINVSAGTSPQIVSLTGQATAPPLPFTYSPTSLDFGSLPVGTTVTKSVTLTNSGGTPLALQVLPLVVQPPNYFIVNNCGSQIPAAGSCTIAVAFESHVMGNWVTSYPTLLNFVVDGTQQSITLSATAYMQQPAISPTSIDFGSVPVGSLSATSGFSVSTIPPSITGAVRSVVASGDFTQTNNCASVNPCFVTITFSPTVTGSRTGAITVNYPSPTPSQVVILSGTGIPSSTDACTAPQLDLKLLVVSNGKTEADFPAIKQILDYDGVPYTVLDFKAQTSGVTAAMLSDGACHGYFQGVIFANGNYVNNLPSMALLTGYEQKFGVRQVNWFASPGAAFDLNNTLSTRNARSTPYSANFTPAAAAVFPSINTNTPLVIANATIYLAPLGGGNVTPLLTDAAGNTLGLIYDQGDGRQYLTLTFDSNQYLTHDLILAYGLVNWVTKGIFLGEHHVYLVPQVDDIFIDNHVWQPGTSCGTDSDADSLPIFRMTGTDIEKLVAWQDSKQANPLLANFRLHWAFNGVGASGNPDNGGYNPDTLTPALQTYKAKFGWISHTWDHEDLNNANTGLTDNELLQNNAMAATLGLPGFTPANLVTPGISGLNNATFINRAVQDGVRYVVSDTSVTGQANNGPNPSPNVGIVNNINNQIYEVPRYPSNLFFNVSKPEEWTAEYHCIYQGQAPYSTYTYQQILDYISADFLINMLKGDMDPEMAHQPNTRAYDGTHSLLGDLVDLTFSKYLSVHKLPVLSPTPDVLAQNMQKRDAYNKSGVTGTYTGGTSPTISITVPASSTISSATVPVTGLNSAGAEVYGGQNISHIVVDKGQTVTLPVQ